MSNTSIRTEIPTVALLLSEQTPVYGFRMIKKTRIYADLTAEQREELGMYPTADQYPVDEDLNKAWKAFNRAEVKAMRVNAEKLLEILGVKDVKLSWNAKGGCACGCSPAFVADRTLTIGSIPLVTDIFSR